MTHDISRITHDPKKHYSNVNFQQGSPLLDADCNEQTDILNHYVRSALKDIIDEGYPAYNPGFKIESIPPAHLSYSISKGHYYVSDNSKKHTLLVECEEDVEASGQPDTPPTNDPRYLALPRGKGIYLVYLDVFELPITDKDNSDIADPALEGRSNPSNRTQIVWQVKLHRLTDDPDAGGITCQSIPHPRDILPNPSGKLFARTMPGLPTEDPCHLPPGRGFRGLENQLYRFEIYNGGKPNDGVSTFFWSRNNCCLEARITNFNGNRITITSLDKDKLLGFKQNQQYFEITDKVHMLNCIPGTIAKCNIIGENDLEVDGPVIGDALVPSNFPSNPKVRVIDSAGIIPITTPSYLQIEDGIEIKFEEDKEYFTRDHYTCCARTALGDIIWPRNGTDPLPKDPDGIIHYYAKSCTTESKRGWIT